MTLEMKPVSEGTAASICTAGVFLKRTGHDDGSTLRIAGFVHLSLGVSIVGVGISMFEDGAAYIGRRSAMFGVCAGEDRACGGEFDEIGHL